MNVLISTPVYNTIIYYTQHPSEPQQSCGELDPGEIKKLSKLGEFFNGLVLYL
jgi:hypothetical protein